MMLSRQQKGSNRNKLFICCRASFVTFSCCVTSIVVPSLSDVVFSVAEATSPVKSGLPVLKQPKNSRKRKNKWFDKSCFELKREVLRFGKLTSKFPSDPIVRGTFLVKKKAYKKLGKTKKSSFKEFLLQKIASFESDNPKDFREMVNELRQKSANQISDKIDVEEWFTYFRKLSTHPTPPPPPITPQRVGLRSWLTSTYLKLLNSQNQINQS